MDNKHDNKMLSNWYYVVYFRALKKNFILPGSWIQNIEIHAKKFFNFGMNTTQSFLCFYTSNPQAFGENKCPKSDWPVNFNLENRDSLQNDGCFIGKLLRCSVNFEDALTYMNARRCIEPAIYNEERLNERPIPEIPIDGERSVQRDNTLLEIDRSLNELELGSEPSSNETIDQIESTVESAIGGTLAGTIDLAINDIVSDDPIFVGENLGESRGKKNDGKCDCENEGKSNEGTEPFESHEVFNDSILPQVANQRENQLQEMKTIVIDDDLTFFVSPDGFAKPLQTTDNCCVKQENDSLSGDIPYYNKKNGRVYKIGESFRLIPSMIVSKLIEWNTSPRDDEVERDKRFVSALFLALMPIENVATGMFIKDVSDFVYELLKVRCHSDEQRLISFEDHKVNLMRQVQENNLQKN